MVLAALILAFTLPAIAQLASPTPQILGPEDPTKTIKVTYWLNQHNKAAFDQLVRQMYTEGSPNYHHWLTPNEYKSRFAPTAADMAVVQRHLAENNLHVVYDR